MTRYPALAPLHPAIPTADGLILRGTLTYPHGQVGTKYPLAVLAHQYPASSRAVVTEFGDAMYELDNYANLTEGKIGLR